MNPSVWWFRVVRTAAFAAAITLLTGCSFLSGAASMRIEVDVYKGPLSNPIEVQKAQLSALLRASRSGLDHVDGLLIDSMCRIGCIRGDLQSSYGVKNLPNGEWEATSPRKGTIDREYEFRPAALVCANRGIPQRRILKATGSCASSSNCYVEKTNNPLNQSSPLKVKPEESDRFADKNYNNHLETDSRFPETEYLTFQTCPTYISIREQLKNVKQAACTTTYSLAGQENPVCKNVDNWTETIPKPFAFRQKFAEEMKKSSASIAISLDAIKAFKATLPPKSPLLPKVDEAIAALQNSLLGPAAVSREQEANDRLTETGEAIGAATKKLADVEKLFGQRIAEAGPSGKLLDSLGTAKVELATALKANDKATVLEEAAAALKRQTAAASSALAVSATRQEIDSLADDVNKIAAGAASLAASLQTFSKPLSEAATIIEDEAKSPLSSLLPPKPNAGKSAIDAASKRIKQDRGVLLEVEKDASGLETKLRKANDARKPPDDQYEQTLNKLVAEVPIPAGKPKPLLDDRKAEFDATIAPLQALTAHLESGKTEAGPSNQALILKLRKAADSALTAAVDMGAATSLAAADSIANRFIKAFTPLLSSLLVPPEQLAANEMQDLRKLRSSLLAKASPAFSQSTLKALDVAMREADTGLGNIVKLVADEFPPITAKELLVLIDQRATLKVSQADLKAIAGQLPKELPDPKKIQAESDIDSYAAVSELAGGFRVMATAISYSLAAVVPDDRRLRIDMARAANMAAEFANQFTARASALSLQTDRDGKEGIDRRALPTGQYLRDSQPTAFLDTYDWLNAAVESDGSGLKPDDRIRTVKRLFADDNWAQVNQVYASGAGDVSMAFIRDDIGNWNLKQFSSDATEITSAYTKLGIGLVDKIADVASGGSTKGLRKAAGLLDTAQAVQSGENASGDLRAGSLIAGLDLAGTRAELVKALADTKSTLALRLKKISDNQPADGGGSKPCAQEVEAEVATCKSEHSAAAIAEADTKIEGIVRQYELLIEALQRVASVSSTVAAPK